MPGFASCHDAGAASDIRHDEGPRSGVAAEQFDHRAPFVGQAAGANPLVELALEFFDSSVMRQADPLLRRGRAAEAGGAKQ